MKTIKGLLWRMQNHSEYLIFSQNFRVSICEKCCFDGMTSLNGYKNPWNKKNLDMIRKLYDVSRLRKSKRYLKNINPSGVMKNLKSHSKQPLGLKRSLLCKKITLENAESFPSLWFALKISESEFVRNAALTEWQV